MSFFRLSNRILIKKIKSGVACTKYMRMSLFIEGVITCLCFFEDLLGASTAKLLLLEAGVFC